MTVRESLAEPAAASPRGRVVIARFPGRPGGVETASHWRIPGLHGNEGGAGRWVRVKLEVPVLGERRTFTVRPDGRSADRIAPGAAHGRASAARSEPPPGFGTAGGCIRPGRPWGRGTCEGGAHRAAVRLAGAHRTAVPGTAADRIERRAADGRRPG